MHIQREKYLKKFARKLRNNGTKGEVILWKYALRKRKMHGYQFNRQFPIGNYIADFISRKLKVVIEIDGYSHRFRVQKDREKDAYLNSIGFTVLRFKEKDVCQDLKSVIRAIEIFVEERESP